MITKTTLPYCLRLILADYFADKNTLLDRDIEIDMNEKLFNAFMEEYKEEMKSFGLSYKESCEISYYTTIIGQVKINCVKPNWFQRFFKIPVPFLKITDLSKP